MNAEALIQKLKKQAQYATEEARRLRQRADQEDAKAQAYSHAAEHVCGASMDGLSKAMAADTCGDARVEVRRGCEWLMQFFAYTHLPPHLQEVSKPFCELANHIVSTLPQNPERTVALRKLLESKDCAVRAVLSK